MKNGVEYRPCPMFPGGGIMAGKDGSVWRFDQVRKLWKQLKRRGDMKGRGHRNGTVLVQFKSDGKQKEKMIAWIVLSAFGIPRPFRSEIHYRDGNPNNCAFSNLTWAPAGSCQAGKPRPGPPVKFGSSRNDAKLTEEAVVLARELYRMGNCVAGIAEHFQVSKTCVHNAITGISWRRVPGAISIVRGERTPRGSFHPNSILDEELAAEIKKLRQRGLGARRIANQLGLSIGAVGNVVRGTSWKHVLTASREDV